MGHLHKLLRAWQFGRRFETGDEHMTVGRWDCVTVAQGCALIVSLCAISDAVLVAQVAPTSTDTIIERFADQLRRDVDADAIGSIAAAVVLGERVIWAGAFGWKDRERRLEADPNTVYRVGSISKSITAVAMMLLAERGALALDVAVERYLPEIHSLANYPDSPLITFENLASHTAGLDREPKLENAAAGPMEQWEQKIIASIPTTDVTAVPGQVYSYSNIGYGILGLAVSRAADRPFMDLVRETVFEPLEMETAGFRPTHIIAPHLATGYVNRRDGTIDPDLPAREHGGRGYKVPNGAVYASVYDLAKFVAAMTGARTLLSDATRTEMLRIQTSASDTSGYGLGFFVVLDDAGRRIAGHGGSVAGYNATIQFDPDARVGVILLRNYNRGRTNLGQIARQMVAEVRATLER